MPQAAIIGGIGAVAAIGSSVIGALSSKEDRDAAQAAQQRALDIIKQTGAPPDLSKQILLEQYKQAGILTPQLEQTVNQQFSQVANIQEDPNLRNAQTNALSQLAQRGQTGLAPEDLAALNQIRSQAQQDAQAKSDQIRQSLQAKGLYGSGQELAAQLASSQAGNQAQMNAGLQQAGQASQRALESLVASGQLGGQLRSQDFNVANTKAQAADELARFNTQNAINNQMRNVNRLNSAQQYNLNQQQQIANMNTQQANVEKYRQAQAQRQYWQDRLGYNQAQANAEIGHANQLNANADRTAQGWANVGSGIATGAGAYANYQGQQNQIDAYNRRTDQLAKNNNQAQNATGFMGDANESGWGGGGTGE